MANPLTAEPVRSVRPVPNLESQPADARRNPLLGDQFHDDRKMLSRFEALMKSQHWLGTYIANLVAAYDRSGDLDFKAAEQLLVSENRQFETDLAVARRMLRLYGDQLPD